MAVINLCAVNAVVLSGFAILSLYDFQQVQRLLNLQALILLIASVFNQRRETAHLLCIFQHIVDLHITFVVIDFFVYKFSILKRSIECILDLAEKLLCWLVAENDLAVLTRSIMLLFYNQETLVHVVQQFDILPVSKTQLTPQLNNYIDSDEDAGKGKEKEQDRKDIRDALLHSQLF